MRTLLAEKNAFNTRVLIDDDDTGSVDGRMKKWRIGEQHMGSSYIIIDNVVIIITIYIKIRFFRQSDK